MRLEVMTSNKQKASLYFFSLLFIYLLTVAIVFQIFGLSHDYIGYKKIFTFDYGVDRPSTEPFFIFLRYINDFFFNSSFLPIIIFSTIFSLYFKWTACEKILGHSFYIVFICHMLCFFPILEYTQIRASCAIGIFLYALPDLMKNNSKKFLLKSSVAILFHFSAVFIFIFFLYVKLFKSKRSYIFFPIFGFLFAIFCNNEIGVRLRDLIYRIEGSFGIQKSGNISNFMSPYNLKYLVLLFTFLLNASVTPKKDIKNMVLLKAMSFGLCFYYWLNPIGLPVISVRLAEFFTSVFVIYFFMNIKNIPVKEKRVCHFCVFLIVCFYSLASIRTGFM